MTFSADIRSHTNQVEDQLVRTVSKLGTFTRSWEFCLILFRICGNLPLCSESKILYVQKTRKWATKWLLKFAHELVAAPTANRNRHRTFEALKVAGLQLYLSETSMPKSTLDTLHMVADATTALAYYWLTYQLLAFAVKSKVDSALSPPLRQTTINPHFGLLFYSS